MNHAVATSLLVAALCSAPALGRAQPSRLVGFGGGLAIGDERTSADTTHPIVQLANLELRLPLTARFELATHVPLASVLYANVATKDQHFLWFDVFAVCYLLRDSSGLFVAPGLGLIYGRTDIASGIAVEVPARVGWEFSSTSRGFATAISIRPWVDVVFPSGNVDVGMRYGLLFELAFTGYVTRHM